MHSGTHPNVGTTDALAPVGSPAQPESQARPAGAVRGPRAAVAAVRRAAQHRVPRGDVGDVPGWVLVTLMTAGLVLALWAVAGPALTELFTTAISRVTSFGG